ncbi:MAG TPA: glycoside hydrolase family 15 protein, partial [Polyangiaceae bacterium]
GNKDGVGTAYSGDSRVWFTIWNGCITEVYSPTIDRPQVRDLQFLVTDGKHLFHEEKRHLRSETVRSTRHGLAYSITNSDPEGRYRIVKEIIAAPHLPCVLQHTRLVGDEAFLSQLRLHVLCAPHLEVGGWGNNAYVMRTTGRDILVAEKNNTWLALAGSVPFVRLSCGYVGASDGWTDLAYDFQMEWEFDRALDGNVALTGELALDGQREFTLALAVGNGLHHAVTALFQALGVSFETHRKRYLEQWERSCRHLLPLERSSGDEGNLFHSSYSLLLSHEDKSFPGAFIASMSIPWGEAKSDEDMGGYHLVWTRDMVNTATGLLAAGNSRTPLRALIYLAATQREDGCFAQNFWINGDPYWSGVQLDEVAFPILLAWRLGQAGGLEDFDPYPMVMRAAGFLIRNGPATQQERWEEAAGYSPSTLASNIAALVCAAGFARARGASVTANYLEEYADFLECHVEAWTVTTQGELHPEVTRHYIRIHPVRFGDPHPDEDPNRGLLAIANRPHGARREFPAKGIVDAGFLELCRYGIRKALDPLMVDSLKVVDHVLRVETPVGSCWRRYNYDGYGQREDGSAFDGWGQGRAWPLLTGERGHHELASGHDASPFIRAMEGFATKTGLLPEQVWDQPDRPDDHMFLGRPTGAAMPLVWAHAEYIKLLRSTQDGRVFDSIPAVAERYLGHRHGCRLLEIWKFNRQASAVRRGFTLRIQAPAAFRLRWTRDEWQTVSDTASTPTEVGIEFVDLAIAPHQKAPIQFTFYWPQANRWEGRDFDVRVV